MIHSRSFLLSLLGTLDLAPRNLSGISITLSALYLVMGLPQHFVSLFMPLFLAGVLCASFFSPWITKNLTRRSKLLGIDFGIRATLHVILLIGILVKPSIELVSVFLAYCFFSGFFESFGESVYNDIAGSIVRHTEIGALYRQNGFFAGILSILFAAVSFFILLPSDPLEGAIFYIVAGAILFLIACFLSFSFSEERQKMEKQTLFIEWTKGLKLFWKTRWFRRYLLAVCFSVPVSIAVPFYTTHAHFLGLMDGQHIPLLICLYSLGAVVAPKLWHVVGKRDARWMIVLSGSLNVLSVLWVLGFDNGVLPLSQHLYCFSYFFLSVAHHGGATTLKSYLTMRATDENRINLFSVYNFVFSIIALVSSIILGTGSHVIHPYFTFLFMGGCGISLMVFGKLLLAKKV